MKVFSTYWKTAKKYKMAIVLYLFIFLIIEILIVKNENNQNGGIFEAESTKIQVINKDGSSELLDHFMKYLSSQAQVTVVADDPEQIADDLYFRKAEYVITIPEGYTQGLIDGEAVKLEKQFIEGSYSDVYVDNLVDKYVDTFNTYQKVMPGMPEGQILDYMNEDLEQETKVEVYKGDNDVKESSVLNQSFNMACYVMLGALMMGITLIMSAFNNTNVRRRSLCSPIREQELNRKIFICNFVLGLGVWLVLMAVEFILCGNSLFTPLGLLLSVNLLVFAIVTVCLSMLIAYAAPSSNIQNILANTLSLGMCFIGGSFVPQELMGSMVNKVASFTPVYWYVKVNDILCNASSFNPAVMQEVYISVFIQLCFAATLLAVALYIGKQKKFVRAFEA